MANVLLKGCRLFQNGIALNQRSFVGGRIQAPFVLNNRGALVVKTTSDVDGTNSSCTSESPSPAPATDVKEKSTPIENQPPSAVEDSRFGAAEAQGETGQISLKRKRLVRKRHLSKKGRCPPSKMEKNKNV